MTMRMLAAAALLAAAASPALAQGIDSRHSPYPASAYSGWIGHAGFLQQGRPESASAPAYRYAGPHAGGPANALPRY
ncbi:hypothetical protein MKK67_29960 [Methylobacterium sp. J-072]|uniref:hypothetical protein n=1 Tax=Methylobacterium sp. J-072 TaxID=2836651 RepID=UPI001FBA25A8|nr:hypothetical protein [Methylobacterium sp. J-072]MCJ2096698.1 hypothetical protein [Methylobacterium sp. J-072]